MNNLGRYFSWLSEVLVILALLLVIANYLGNEEPLIKSDGKGYYDYLPATFIYNDLNFHFTDTIKTDYYDQKSYSSKYLKIVNGHQIDKYFPGVALLWTPFFLGAHYYALNSENVANGYSSPYQNSIYFAALFYLWIGLVFLRKLLQGLGSKRRVIFTIQLLLVLASPIVHYVQYDPAFTHVYSFSLITIFTFYLFRFLRNNKTKDILIAGFILGLIVIIRPVNLLAVGIIILYFKSIEEFITYLYRLVSDLLKPVFLALIPFFMVISIVPLLWHYQTGQFLVWGYQDEGFNFLDPAFFDFLFSFRKGVFLYTPLLFVASISAMVIWLRKNSYFQILAFVFLISLISYVLSSWWVWSYGASFGSRSFIDFYVIFAIVLATALNTIKSFRWFICASLSLSVFIPLNLIQAHQFQTYIMEWDNMTYKKFTIIGLHTEAKYIGVFFKNKIDYTSNDVIEEYTIPINTLTILQPEETRWFSPIRTKNLPNIENIEHIVVTVDMAYKEGLGDIILSLNDSTDAGYYWVPNGIFSSSLQENTRTKVQAFFKIPPIKPGGIIHVAINSKGELTNIYGITVKLIAKKEH